MENNGMHLAELEELEAFEIDAVLLTDLLEEEHEDDNGIKQRQEVDKDKSMMIDKEEEEKQQQSWLKQNEWHGHDFEWLNMMEMEPLSPNEAMVNWYPDDVTGMTDFGYTNCQDGTLKYVIWLFLMRQAMAAYGRICSFMPKFSY